MDKGSVIVKRSSMGWHINMHVKLEGRTRRFSLLDRETLDDFKDSFGNSWANFTKEEQAILEVVWCLYA